jgi:hypothetical protein
MARDIGNRRHGLVSPGNPWSMMLKSVRRDGIMLYLFRPAIFGNDLSRYASRMTASMDDKAADGGFELSSPPGCCGPRGGQAPAALPAGWPADGEPLPVLFSPRYR